MPINTFPDEELIQEEDKMTLEIEKRRLETEKKIYFALKKILNKSPEFLTVEDKKFLKARVSYLTKAEQQEFAEVLNEDLTGQAPSEPKLENMSRNELEVMAGELGVPEPDKLPNKAAVIDAIRAAKDAQANG